MSFNGVNFEFTIDTVMLIVLFNVVGTVLQILLTYLHDKKQWSWSDGPLKAVKFMMSMVAFIIANKSHPLTKPEGDESKK